MAGLAGLVPAIHVFLPESPQEDVDAGARDKRGHDGGEVIPSHRTRSKVKYQQSGIKKTCFLIPDY
jgi:hypothetical protein